MKKLFTLVLGALLLGAPATVNAKADKDKKDGKAKTEQTDKQARKAEKQKAEEAKMLEKAKKKNPKKLSKKEKALLAREQQAEKARRDAEAKAPKVNRPGLISVVKDKKNQWYFELADSALGRDMLVTTRYISTPSDMGKFGGEQVNQQVVFFEMNGDSTILLRSRMTVNVADTADAINKAIEISNSNPIIGAFALDKKESRGHRLRFDVTQYLLFEDILGIPQGTRGAYGIGSQDRAASYISDIKSFPTNTEVRVVKTYNSSNGSMPSARSTGKLTFELNISFVELPANPMMPRYFDPRVGYFTHSYRSYSDQQQRVEAVSHISRWRLEPRPEDVEKMRRGELVEPIKPIVYYIDPATPKQWRKYLIQGVNDWQVAFEKAGFKNAIYALEWPEDADSMSMEDARYSVIRYLASPIPNAYGPHVSDPRTGEIIESHICWYHNVMKLVHDWYMVQAGSIDEAAQKMNYDEELMGQLIRFVSSHEVGHTLGLRHNFGSSATVPVEKLRDKAWVEAHGHTPSIMDYARFNYVAQPEDGIDQRGIFPRINDYDIWAIQWGYQPMPDATDALSDHQALEAMTAEAQKNPRLWFGDGETWREDPRCQTEDLGDDPVKAGGYGILNLQRGVKQLDKWTDDDPKDIYGDNLETIWEEYRSQFLRYMGHAIRYIGGAYKTYNTREQGGTTFEPTPLARQKDVMQFVNRHALQEPAWFREPAYTKTFTADTRRLTLPIARSVAYMLVNRIDACNELYPAQQYIDDIVRLSFSELSGQKVSLSRQPLQSNIVNRLIGFWQAEGVNVNAYKGAIQQALQSLSRRAKAYAGSDKESKNFYTALADRIDRALVIK